MTAAISINVRGVPSYLTHDSVSIDVLVVGKGGWVRKSSLQWTGSKRLQQAFSSPFRFSFRADPVCITQNSSGGTQHWSSLVWRSTLWANAQTDDKEILTSVFNCLLHFHALSRPFNHCLCHVDCCPQIWLYEFFRIFCQASLTSPYYSEINVNPLFICRLCTNIPFRRMSAWWDILV